MNQVKAWRELLQIPTYAAGKPDPLPMFLEKRVYQGSSGKIYPHAIIDTVSDEKCSQTYEAVFLENDYLLIMFLPELGGRVQRALDKTNQYDFIYYNQVIKPALVGLAGPWISGGIEFNWPQHHRPSTFDPVHWSIQENKDGSCTVWIGEWENMFRTRCASAFTLYPDKAYLEIRTNLFNATSAPQTFLWWANPAVAVNDDTQSIFPPDVHAVMDHGKRDVSSFPIATGVYYKKDYAPGTDISRYRNIPVPTSYMAYQSSYDFVGNYDHGRQAGMLHVADHHISPGKKQWTWGNGEFGQAWDRNLTDEDGPYIELMTGCFTDNQPDFTWLMPCESKSFTQYFMPYKQIGTISNANRDAAIHVEYENGTGRIGIYSTGEFPGVCITVREGDQVLLTQTADLHPAQTIDLTVEAASPEITVTLTLADGMPLITCEPDHSPVVIPEPASPIPAPEKAETCEELLLYGMHIEQYRHATRDASLYYLEGLRRDPTDMRLNNAYGKWLMKKGRLQESKTCFERAIAKQTIKNPNPYDGEPLFNLGVCCRLLGETDRAYDSFYKATWNAAWQAPSFYHLGSIDLGRRRFRQAREHLTDAIDRNGRNLQALNAMAALCRLTGRNDEAVSWAERVLAADPHDVIALRELALLGKERTAWLSLPGLNHNNCIEYALCYAGWGMHEDAADILLSFAKAQPAANQVYPLIWYYLASFTGDKQYLALAEAAEHNGCFPHRLEDMLVLRQACASGQPCARASYYLGNLLYDKGEYDQAMVCWENAIAERDDLFIPHRNLAIGYFNKLGRREEALQQMEQAFRMQPDSSRLLFEMDLLKRKLDVSHQERLDCLDKNRRLTEQRDDLMLEYITCLNVLGRHEEALELLMSRQFHPWEGGEGKIPAQWRLALMQLARRIAAENPEKALELLKTAAGSYPFSFGEGKLTGAQENDLYYNMGLVLRRMNREEEAAAAFQRASTGLSVPARMLYYNDQPPEMIYYQGLACRALGQEEEACDRFQRLVDYGKAYMSESSEMDYFAVSLPELQIFDEDLTRRNRSHCLFMQLLGYSGLGMKPEMEDALTALQASDPICMAEKHHIPEEL